MADPYLDNTEHRLFHLVAQGNENAFNDLFHLFLPKLHPFIIRIARKEDAAKEIIQETFLRVWMNRDKLEQIENPAAWLYKVASNECYTYLRKQVTRQRLFQSQEGVEEFADQQTFSRMDLNDVQRLIQEAVTSLPAQRQKIYWMSRQQGMTIPEIAQELKLSPNTVKNALVTALRSIREYLSRYGIIFLLGIVL